MVPISKKGKKWREIKNVLLELARTLIAGFLLSMRVAIVMDEKKDGLPTLKREDKGEIQP